MTCPESSATALDRLRHCRLCEGLEAPHLKHVADVCSWRKLEPGDTLTVPGDSTSGIYIVARGRLQLFQNDDEDEEQLIGYANQGESVGEALLLVQSDYHLRAVADMPCLIAEISRPQAKALLVDVPRFRENLIASFGQRVNSVLRGRRLKRVPRVVGVLQPESLQQDLLSVLNHQLRRCQETTAIFSAHPQRYESTTNTFPLPASNSGTAADELRAAIRQQIAAGHRILIDITLPMPLADVRALADQCDEILWCYGTDRAVDDGRDLVRQLVAECRDLESRLVAVEILGRGHAVGVRKHFPFAVLQTFRLPAVACEQELAWRCQQNLDRIVRHLRGIRIGLALGGGGARGLSHLGVLKVLDQAQISVDLMSGTSAGAMIGLGYAAGLSTDFLIEAFPQALAPPELLNSIPGGRRLFLFAKFFDRAWEELLRRYFHDWTFEQLLIPFSVVATDLVSGGQVLRERGDVVHAILESINVPLLSDPILKDGMVLVDGGVTNNLPVELLSQRGAQYVIGVDASKQIPTHFADNFSHMTTDQMSMPGKLETAYRVMEVSRRGIAELQMRYADLVIEPDTSAFDFADFTAAKELAATGAVAAEQMLPEIRAAYDKLMTGPLW